MALWLQILEGAAGRMTGRMSWCERLARHGATLCRNLQDRGTLVAL